MPGFEKSRFVDLTESQAKHFTCSFCLNVFNNAVRSVCEHTFCKNCVQQWIVCEHKECPECRHPFTMKRTNDTRDEPNLVIIYNYIFKTNLMANNLINDLKIKCDFEFNGCKHIIELGLLEGHINECQHKYCKDCYHNYSLVPNREHNCLEILKKDRNLFLIHIKKLESEVKNLDTLKNECKEIKGQYESSLNTIKQMAENNKSVTKEIDSIFELFSQIDSFDSISVDYVILGNYRSTTRKLELSPQNISIYSVLANTDNSKKMRYNITICFDDIQQLMYCFDSRLWAFVLKINTECCHQIQEFLSLGEESQNDFKFDVNSNGIQSVNVLF